MPVGYAVVGLGNFAIDRILPALKRTRYSALTAVVSGDPNKSRRFGAKYGAVRIYNYENFDSIKEDPDIDAVYIALPNALHWEYTVRAAKAGKHVLCEKPMANSPAECLNMIEECRRNDVKLMIGYRVHFDPGNREAIRLIEEGEIGYPKFMTATFSQRMTEPEQWRLNYELSGGGALMDIGIYCVNACRYLLDDEPESVLGMVSSTETAFSNVEENCLAILQFPEGVLASVNCSYGSRRVDTLLVDGSEGWLEVRSPFDYWTPREINLRRGEAIATRRFDPGDQVAAEIDYFSQCIRSGIEPGPNGLEGLKDMVIIESIYRSARDGCRVHVNYQSVASAA